MTARAVLKGAAFCRRSLRHDCCPWRERRAAAPVAHAVRRCALLCALSRPSVGRSAYWQARNLGLIASTRAAARIVTPTLSASLFDLSTRWSHVPGSLPYLILGSLCAALAPVPLILKKRGF